MSENEHLERLEKAYLKRQIVRQTIADNLALIKGTRLETPHRPKREVRRGLWRWAAAAVVLLPLAAASLFFARPNAHARLDTQSATPRSATPQSTTVPPKPPPPEAAAPTRSPRWPPPSATLTPIVAPERIDPSIFPLAVHHIVLDPGHGGEDAGTLSGTLREKEITLDIALRLRARLESEGFAVSMTRETDRAVVLRERSDFANEVEADLFLSIHINSIYTQVRGVETYFLGPTKDPELNALARRENQNSGYSLADQDNLIRSVILNAQHDRSRDLASHVHRSLYQSLRPINPELRDRGVKTAPFVVLVATEMPAILAEVSTLSNAEEAELLTRPLYREHIAEALFKGIRQYADDVNSSEEKGSGP